MRVGNFLRMICGEEQVEKDGQIGYVSHQAVILVIVDFIVQDINKLHPVSSEHNLQDEHTIIIVVNLQPAAYHWTSGRVFKKLLYSDHLLREALRASMSSSQLGRVLLSDFSSKGSMLLDSLPNP